MNRSCPRRGKPTPAPTAACPGPQVPMRRWPNPQLQPALPDLRLQLQELLQKQQLLTQQLQELLWKMQ